MWQIADNTENSDGVYFSLRGREEGFVYNGPCSLTDVSYFLT